MRHGLTMYSEVWSVSARYEPTSASSSEKPDTCLTLKYKIGHLQKSRTVKESRQGYSKDITSGK